VSTSVQQFRIWYSTRPEALRLLITVNVCFYVLWALILVHLAVPRTFVMDYLALDASWSRLWQAPWQLVTYSFLHIGLGIGGLLHIGFNMLWLYWIGQDTEDLYGPETLLSQYFLSAIGGALLCLLIYGLTDTQPVRVYGASGAVLGVMTALAIRQPQKRIRLFLFGSIRVIHLVIAFLILDLLTLAGGRTAIPAHFGGALTGALYAWLEARSVNLSSWTSFAVSRGRRPRGGGFFARLEQRLEKAPKRKSDTSHPIESEEELDRILDKIGEHGLESLTPRERKALERFSRSR